MSFLYSPPQSVLTNLILKRTGTQRAPEIDER
jgi:hypothetical protein